MKKRGCIFSRIRELSGIIIIMLLLSLIGSQASAQVTLLSEDFENTVYGWSGWSQSSSSTTPTTTGNYWVMGTTGATGTQGIFTVTGAGGCGTNNGALSGTFSPRISYYKSNNPGAGVYCSFNNVTTTNRRVYTPLIDATNYGTLVLTFNYVISGSANAYGELQYSTDGSTWTTVPGETYNSSVTSTTLRTVNLPVALANTPFYLGWSFTANTSATAQPTPTFIFDDVSVTGVCLAASCTSGFIPSTGTSFCGTSPTLTWNTGGGCITGYKVYLDQNASPTTLVSTQSALSYKPSGLLANTTYYWKIVPYNGSGDATGCTVQSFTTGTAVTGPTASNVSRCGTGTVILTASGGTNYSWYDANAGGNLVGTTASYTTPSLSSTTTYYVENSSVSSETSLSTGTTATTTFTATVGYMFNVKNINANSINITRLSTRFFTAGSKSVSVYYKSGTYQGSEFTAGNWTLAGTYVVTAVTGSPTIFDIDDIQVPSGQTYGVYIYTGSDGGAASSGSVSVSSADITLTSGTLISALNGAFTSGASTYLYAGWSFQGAVYYKTTSCYSSRTAVQAIITAAPVAAAGSDINSCTGSGTAVTMTGASATGSFTSATWTGGGGLGTWSQNADPSLATFTPSSASGSFTATLALTGSGACAGTNPTSTRVVSWGPVGTWLGGTSTAWGTASNWGCSTIPASITDVTIPSTATNMPTISTSGNTVKSITINSGATLTMTSAGALMVSGDWTNNGTFTGNNASTVTFGGTTQQIAGSSTTAFGIITIANGSTVTGSVAHTATTFNINNGGKYIHTSTAGNSVPGSTTKNFVSGSTYEIQNPSLSFSTNTYGYLIINFTGSNSLDAGGTNLTSVLNDLYIKNTGTGQFRVTSTGAGTLTIGGNIQVDAGTFVLSFTTGTPIVNVTGNVILNGGTFKPMQGTGVPTLNVKGNWTNNGATFTPSTTTVTFNGTGSQTMNGTATSQTFYNVAVAKTVGTFLNTGGSTTAVTVQDFTETTGNFTAPATFNVNGNLTLTAGTFTAGATINAAGNWTHTSGAIFAPGTNTVNFTGTGAQTINGTASSETFYNVAVTKTAGTLLNTGGSVATITTQDLTETTGNFTAPATLNVNGNTLLTAGTFTAGTNVKSGGDWTNNGGTFTPGSNTVTFNGIGAQTINGTATAQTFYNLVVGKTAGTLLSTGGSTVTLTTQDFTETSGNFTAPATLNINGNVTLTAGTFTAGTNINAGGNWANNGATFTAGTGTVSFTATATGKTLTGTLNGTSKFNNLTFNGVGGGWTVSPAIEATGNFNLTNGTLTLSATLGNDLTIGGNWTRASTGTFAPNTRAVFFNGSSSQTIAVTGGGTQAFDYLGINNTSIGGVVLSSSPATSVSIASTAGNVLQLLNSGPLDLNGQTLTLSGSGGNIYVSGGIRNITATTAGTLSIAGTKTVATASGGTLTTSANVTIALSSGLDFGPSLTTVNGTFRIDAGGFVTGNAPIYGTGSLLKYNTGSTPYGRSLEWKTATGPGYPYNVQISNNTTLSPGANANTATTFSLAGNLTIDAGSAMYMDYGGVNMAVPLNIVGNLVLNGSLSESAVIGGDININGDWTNNGGFFNNTRTVTFNNTTTDQNISGSAATTFGYLTLNKTSGIKVILSGSNGITVNNTATITLGTLVTNSNTVTLGGTASLSEASGQTILGNVTTTRSIAANTANTFGGIGLSITAINTPGSTIVTRVTGTAVTITNVGTVKRYFTIVPTTTATGATVAFTYDVSELNGLTAAYLGLYDAPSPYTIYTSEGGTASSYTITLTGASVTNSRWTAGGACYIWTGNASTDWNTTGNWLCGNVPTSTSNVVIPNPLTNQPTISSGTYSVNNLQIAGNSTLTNNGTLKIGGVFSISANGYVDNTNGTIEMNGTGAQSIPTSTFINNTVKNLTISNTGGTVSLNGALALTGVLSVTGGQTFATNGNLTLKSSASATAQVAAVTGSITGNVIAERYIPAHRAWRLLATPVISSQTINAAWQEGQHNTDLVTMVNTAPGYGTQITGPNPTTNNLDVSPRNNYSMLSFVDTTTWNGVSNTNLLLSSQPAWMLFVRGDRSIDLNLNQYATPTTTRLRSTGPLRTGQKTFSIASTGFTLVGNPYASAFNFHTAASKVGAPSDKFIVWDPNMTGQYGVGAFVTFTWNGSSYTHTTSASSNLDEHIQSGEAFIVPGNGSTTTLTIDESDKNSGSVSTIFSPTTSPESFTANLYTANNDGSKTLVDGTIAIFGSNYDSGLDNVDTKKLSNFNENIGLKREGSVLAIEARPIINLNDTLQLDLTQTKIQNYKLEIVCDRLDHPGLQGLLFDKYTNSTTTLSLNDTTYYSFGVNSTAASYAADRFSVIFTTATPLAVSYTTIRAYQQSNGINVEWGVTNEVSMREYQVEKSETGNDFSKIGIVPAKANNGGSGSYAWTDINPKQGANFYRIRSLSLSGEVKYSNIVKVVLGGKPGFVVYPNPITEGTINLQMNNLRRGTYSVKLFDEQGQIVYSKDITHQDGSSAETLKTDKNLPHGNYYLEITDSEQVSTKIKIIN